MGSSRRKTEGKLRRPSWNPQNFTLFVLHCYPKKHQISWCGLKRFFVKIGYRRVLFQGQFLVEFSSSNPPTSFFPAFQKELLERRFCADILGRFHSVAIAKLRSRTTWFTPYGGAAQPIWIIAIARSFVYCFPASTPRLRSPRLLAHEKKCTRVGGSPKATNACVRKHAANADSM